MAVVQVDILQCARLFILCHVGRHSSQPTRPKEKWSVRPITAGSGPSCQGGVRGVSTRSRRPVGVGGQGLWPLGGDPDGVCRGGTPRSEGPYGLPGSTCLGQPVWWLPLPLLLPTWFLSVQRDHYLEDFWGKYGG